MNAQELQRSSSRRDVDAENRMPRGKIEDLEELIRQLREQLVPPSSKVMKEWMLSSTEARIFSHLTTREIATRESILAALYSDRAEDYPSSGIISVFIVRMRKKLKPFNVTIETVWGVGFSLKDRHQFVAGGDA